MRKNVKSSVLPEIERAWQNYLFTGRFSDAVRPEIAESWQRCRRADVDPYDGVCHCVLEQRNLRHLLETHSELIEVARPFMEKLYRFVEGSGFIVMLTDERGYIMANLGDADTLENALKINFVNGAHWTEEEVGTNAIGTALSLRRPIQVSGAEHYCQKHHGWTCSAAPIIDQMSGRLIGVLDLSGPSEETHLHTLGMVVAAVAAIVDQLRVREKNRELALSNNRLTNIFQTMSDGVILIDKAGIIIGINPVAEQIFGRPNENLRGRAITEIVGNQAFCAEAILEKHQSFDETEVMVDTPTGHIHCVSSGKPTMDDEGQVSGGVILLHPIQKIHSLVNRMGGSQATFHFRDIIGDSVELREVIELAASTASSMSNVLLQGESGTGKEVFAQAIHNRSPRRRGPFVAINCGAIPRDLIASELFGYVEGAFTGARRGGRPGKFELASGGTLFLDEIGDMPLEQQVALLRVLQEKKITRIGSDKVIPVDVRIICATNKDLLEEVRQARFREDLYYRLNVISIVIPPLRDRPDDISVLAEYFLKKFGREMGAGASFYMDDEVVKRLMQYDWPGNVRQLQNVLERMVNIADGYRLGIEHLPVEIYQPREDAPDFQPSSLAQVVRAARKNREKVLEEQEYRELVTLLQQCGGNISQVARKMEVSRNTIYRKMRKYKIKR